VVVEGTAERVTDHARLVELAALWKARHDWNYQVLDDTFDDGAGHVGLVFAVRPAKVLAFGKKPHIQTRYRFSTRVFMPQRTWPMRRSCRRPCAGA
jgi:hypothetical protein